MYSGRDFALDLRAAGPSQLSRRARAGLRALRRGAAPDRVRQSASSPCARILVGGERALTARFAALASHYLLEPCFCRPGDGHDKGGVEGRGQGVRHADPDADSVGADARRDQSRAARAAGCAARDGPGCGGPDHRDALRGGAGRVPRGARAVCRRGDDVRDGVSPGRWSGSRGRSTRCRVAGPVSICGPRGRDDRHDRRPDGTRIAHPRKRFGQRSIDYRHYLPELARKPQAVRQVLPDLLRDLGAPFPAVWARFVAAHAAPRRRPALREGARADRHPRARRRRRAPDGASRPARRCCWRSPPIRPHAGRLAARGGPGRRCATSRSRAAAPPITTAGSRRPYERDGPDARSRRHVTPAR